MVIRDTERGTDVPTGGTQRPVDYHETALRIARGDKKRIIINTANDHPIAGRAECGTNMIAKPDCRTVSRS